jgi:hypothetical protein
MKRSSQVLILDTNPDIFLEGLKKTWKSLIRIAIVPEEIGQLGIGYLEMSVWW